MTDENERKYLTVPEVAEVLEVSVGTVYKEIERGSLGAKRFGKRNIKISKTELRRYEQESDYEAGQYRVSPMKGKERPDLRKENRESKA